MSWRRWRRRSRSTGRRKHMTTHFRCPAAWPSYLEGERPPSTHPTPPSHGDVVEQPLRVILLRNDRNGRWQNVCATGPQLAPQMTRPFHPPRRGGPRRRRAIPRRPFRRGHAQPLQVFDWDQVMIGSNHPSPAEFSSSPSLGTAERPTAVALPASTTTLPTAKRSEVASSAGSGKRCRPFLALPSGTKFLDIPPQCLDRSRMVLFLTQTWNQSAGL
jgi:hypothetical protein